MTPRTLCLLALAIGLFPLFGFTACGPAPEPPEDAIADAMVGTWRGPMDIVSTGSHTSVESTVVVAIATPVRAEISGLCQNMSAVLPIVGSGTRLAWQDTFSCPPAVFNGCEASVVVFTDVSVSLFSGSNLNITATGTATGCGATVPLRVVFDGLR
jgi:hypothetical protein